MPRKYRSRGVQRSSFRKWAERNNLVNNGEGVMVPASVARDRVLNNATREGRRQLASLLKGDN
jgi:hypothetical protein